MSIPLLKLSVTDTGTVSLARQRAREIAAALGLDRYGQVRVATAVSEIVRNAHAYASGGRVEFALEPGEPSRLRVRVSDAGGAGLPRPRTVPARDASGEIHGLEIVRRLADRFERGTVEGGGTSIAMDFRLPAGAVDVAAVNALLDSLPRPAARSEADQLRESNAALLASLAQAEKAVTTREELLAIVSHDLRNPLGAIVTSAEALEYAVVEGPAGELVDEMRDAILRSAHRMEKLIADLLDLASLQSGTLGVTLARTDGRAIVAACVRDLHAAARARDIVLVHGDTPGPVLHCDHDRVLQILSNLVGNAIKFSEPGGRIVVDVRRDGRFARFSVLDSGRGMTPDEVARVFDRHWQRDRADGRGIGLGMSIVRALVEAHAGEIDVESEPGAGTCVRVGLPLVGRPD